MSRSIQSKKTEHSKAMEEHLTPFQHVLMVSISRNPDYAFSGYLHEYIQNEIGISAKEPQIRVTLQRLEKKGYLDLEQSVPSPLGNSRSVTMYKITDKGIDVLEKTNLYYAVINEFLTPSSPENGDGIER